MIPIACLGVFVGSMEISLVTTYVFFAPGPGRTPLPVLYCWSVATIVIWLGFFVLAAFRAANRTTA